MRNFGSCGPWVVGVVVIATSIYVINKTNILEVSHFEDCRNKIIELTETHTGERLKQEVDIIYDAVFSSYDISDTAGDLEMTLRVIHEFFADATDHISPTCVDAINRTGLEM